jgi:hypothetical protein
MRAIFRIQFAGLIAIAGLLASGTPSARAQMAMSGAGGRSLGGYGSSAISSYYGGGSTAYLPYSGNAHGFVPYRGGSGGGLGVQPVARGLPRSSIGGTGMNATPIGGGSLSGGMGGDRRGGMGMGISSGRGMLVPFGYEGGIGSGMGGMSTMSRGRGDGRVSTSTGPGFGYPFRTPPSLGGASSMAMP